ncbi:hypothetical protein JTB14_027276 [Gonioctena quinquepunctata]|nr:hypothetical protein JTB14_027276 [Gonioctena quinquepunctata]
MINIVRGELEDSKYFTRYIEDNYIALAKAAEKKVCQNISSAPENNVIGSSRIIDGTVENRRAAIADHEHEFISMINHDSERMVNVFLDQMLSQKMTYNEKMQNRWQHSMDIMTFEVTRILKQKFNDPSRRDGDLERMINIVSEQLEDSKYFTRYMGDNYIALVKAAWQKVCENISLVPENIVTGSLRIIDGTVEISIAAISDHNMTYLEKIRIRCQHSMDIMTFEVTRILKQKYNDPFGRDEDLKRMIHIVSEQLEDSKYFTRYMEDNYIALVEAAEQKKYNDPSRRDEELERMINIVSEQLEDSKYFTRYMEDNYIALVKAAEQKVCQNISLAPENNVAGSLRIIDGTFENSRAAIADHVHEFISMINQNMTYLGKMQNRCQHSMDIMTFEVTRILKQKYNDPSRRDEDLKRMIDNVSEQLEDSKYFTRYIEDDFIVLVKAAEQKNMTYLEKMQNRCQHSMDIMTFEVTRILKQKYNDPSRRDGDLERMINIVSEQLEDSKYFTSYMEDNYIALVNGKRSKPVPAVDGYYDIRSN